MTRRILLPCIVASGLGLGLGCGDNLTGLSDSGATPQPADAALELDAAPEADAPPSADKTACDDEHGDALVCGAFESADFPWFQSTNNGALAVSNDPLFRGDGSLQAHIVAAGIEGTNASAERTLDTPLSTGSFHFRAYYFIPSGVFDYLQIVKFLENGGGFSGVNVAVTGGAMPFIQALGETQIGSEAFPLDEWFCLQYSVTIDETAGSAELLVDGNSLATLTDVPTLPPSAGYSLFGVGVEYANAGQPVTSIYVDEVVLDTSPVACEPN